MRWSWVLLLGGCSVIVPGPDDFTYGDADAGRDGGAVPIDSGADADVDLDAGPDCALMVCGADCVDTQTSLEHCGRCDNPCGTGEECRAGECFDPVVDVAAGPHHTCAVRASGEVWCWGVNETGQLGDDSVFDSSVPVRVVGIDDAVQISCGGYALRERRGSCCTTSRNGRVRCWGDVGPGIAGFGNQVVTAPAELTVPPSREVRVGFEQGCVVTTSGALYCWQSRDDAGMPVSPTVTTGLGIGGSWVAGAAGAGNHLCVLTVGGQLQCRGENTAGQLGDDPSSVPRRSEFWPAHSAIDDARLLSTTAVSTCVTRMGGATECWGSEASLGIGSFDTTRSQHMAQVVLGVTDVARLHGTDFGAITCAVRTSGVVTCWGGRLIDNAGAIEFEFGGSPYELPGVVAPSDLALGTGHQCAVVGGIARCRGLGDRGQLGDGTMGGRLEFGDVVFP